MTSSANPGPRTVFVHIGMHKTGTTAIQHFLERNREPLRRRGLCYPGYYFGYAMRLRFPDWRAYLDRLKEVAAAAGEGDLVISDEDLSACQAHIPDILHALGGFRPRLVCYVRRQDAWLQSFYAQFVTWPDDYTGAFEDWLAEHGHGLADYHARLKPWADAVGMENFTLRVYEKGRAPTWLLDDFLGCIGIADCDAFDFTTQAREENLSLDRDCLEVKRLINRVGLDIERSKRIADVLQGITARRARGRADSFPFLSPGQRLAVVERYAASNRRLAREFLGRQDGALFTEPLPEAGAEFAPYPGLDPEAAYAIMAELIASLAGR